MKRREPLSLDLTPLIDIIFIIIIFFLVTSTFKKENFLNLTLPKSKSTTKQINTKNITIQLTPKYLAYNNQKIDFIALQTRLEKIQNKSKPIILKVDKNTKYDRLVKLLDLLKLNELNNLIIATKQ
jgi:biopolymer transport protein ExbD